MGFHQSEGSRVASILLASLLKIDLTKFSQHAAACRKKTGSKGADGRAHIFLNNNHNSGSYNISHIVFVFFIYGGETLSFVDSY